LQQQLDSAKISSQQELTDVLAKCQIRLKDQASLLDSKHADLLETSLAKRTQEINQLCNSKLDAMIKERDLLVENMKRDKEECLKLEREGRDRQMKEREEEIRREQEGKERDWREEMERERGEIQGRY